MRRLVPLLLVLATACSKPPTHRRGPAPLTDAERRYLTGLSRRALRTYLTRGRVLRASDVPPALHRFDRRVVFLTFHLEGETRGCTAASRSDIGTNVVRATVSTVRDSRYVRKGVRAPDGSPVTLRPTDVDRVRLEINLLGRFERLYYRDADSLRGEIDPGVHGIRIRKGRKGAYYLPYVAIEFEYDTLPLLRTLSRKAKLKFDDWKKAGLWRFEVENFVEEKPGGRALPLWRWNVLVHRMDVADLERALSRARGFLRTLAQRPHLALGYQPKWKRWERAAPRWIALRTAEVLAYAAGNDPATWAVVNRLLGDASPAGKAAGVAAPGGKRPSAAARRLDARIRAKLARRRGLRGAMAPPPPAMAAGEAGRLAAELLARLMRHRRLGRKTDLARARDLADRIERLTPGGAVTPGTLASWEREHEEALLVTRALARWVARGGTARLLKHARAIFERTATEHAGRVDALPELIRTALVLHRAHADASLLRRARAWGERLLAIQLPATTPDQDWRGGLNLERIPAARDGARAALAFAALAAAGEARFRQPAFAAARFVLNLQYRDESAFAFPHLDRYLGGVRLDLYRVRANLEATLAAAEAWNAVKALLRPGEVARFTPSS